MNLQLMQTTAPWRIHTPTGCTVSSKPAHPRRGLSLYVILCTLVVVSIFAFATSTMVTQNIRQARLLADSRAALLLDRSAVACAIGQIQDALENPQSQLHQVLTAPDLASGTQLAIDLAPLEAVRTGYRDAAITVAATIERISPLDGLRLTRTTGGGDPIERRCVLCLQLSGRVGSAEINRSEYRELRIVNLLPGILGKFTLYVRQAAGNSPGFNRFANDINGWADDQVPPADRIMPIILKNGGELDGGQDSWKKRGFVYLGGGKVSLNLTAGNDEAYGENFLFYSMTQTPSIPGYYDPFPPDFFTKPPDFTKRHPQSLNTGGSFVTDFAYCLKRVVSGFYTTDADGKDMNIDKRLGVTFPGTPQACDPRMRSSILHLYGTRSNPSPTLVLGSVYRRYAEYAGVVVEATGDSRRDAILTYVYEHNGAFDQLPAVPTTVAAAANGGLPAGTPIQFDSQQVCYDAMFQDPGTYQNHMCRIIEEPYLRSHDFLYFRQDGIFEPTQSLFGQGIAQTQQICTLEFHPGSPPPKPF